MTPKEIRALYEYDAWANGKLLQAAAALTDEQFTRGLGSSFSSVRDTLAHIMGAQWVWLERWQGRTPRGLPPAGEFRSLSSLGERWTEIEAKLLQFIARLKAKEIAAPRPYTTTEGKKFKNPLWQQLQHVVNHGTYHRGQVTTMLRQLETKSPSTDLIVFYREQSRTKSA